MTSVQKLLNNCYRKSVCAVLEDAKAVAAEYKLHDFEKWADRELEGYDKNDPDALPEYRWVVPTTKNGSVKIPVFDEMMLIERVKIYNPASISIRWDQETYEVSKAQCEPLFRAVRDKIFNTVTPLNTQNSDASAGNVFVENSVVVGPINTGQQTGNQIDVSIASLRDANHEKVAEAFEAIKNEIAADKKLTEQQQTEILQMLNLLAAQASLPEQERLRGIIKPMLTGLATALSAGGGAAAIWDKFGPTIMSFFGM